MGAGRGWWGGAGTGEEAGGWTLRGQGPGRSQERGRTHGNPGGGVGTPGRTWSSPTVAQDPCSLCDTKALIAKPVVSLPNSTTSGVALQDLGDPVAPQAVRGQRARARSWGRLGQGTPGISGPGWIAITPSARTGGQDRWPGRPTTPTEGR